MLPLILSPASRRVALIGEGGAAFRRFEFLQDARIEQLSIYIGNHDGWACQAEAAVYERWPAAGDLDGVGIVFIAGLAREPSEKLAELARRAGALVNVEDVPELCDFHVPAVVRRGELVVTVSTGGKAPGLSRILREWLEDRFSGEWTARLNDISAARTGWREDGLSPNQVSQN